MWCIQVIFEGQVQGHIKGQRSKLQKNHGSYHIFSLFGKYIYKVFKVILYQTNGQWLHFMFMQTEQQLCSHGNENYVFQNDGDVIITLKSGRQNLLMIITM